MSEPSKAARDAVDQVLSEVDSAARFWRDPDRAVIQRAIDSAVADERERCARVAGDHRGTLVEGIDGWHPCCDGKNIAVEIRAVPPVPGD